MPGTVLHKGGRAAGRSGLPSCRARPRCRTISRRHVREAPPLDAPSLGLRRRSSRVLQLLAEEWLGDRSATVLKLVVQVGSGWAHPQRNKGPHRVGSPWQPAWLGAGTASDRGPRQPGCAACLPACLPVCTACRDAAGSTARTPAHLPRNPNPTHNTRAPHHQCSCFAQGLTIVRPSLYAVNLTELCSNMARLAGRAGAALQQLAGIDPQSSSALTTGAARCGKLMLVG